MGLEIKDSRGSWLDVTAFDFEDFAAMGSPRVIDRKEVYSYESGEASVRQIFLPDIYIVLGDLIMHEKVFGMRGNNLPEFVELHFSINGGCTVKNNINNKSYTWKSNHQNVYFVPELDGEGHYMADRGYQFFEVHFTKKRFLELADNATEELRIFAEKITKGQIAEIGSECRPITLSMHQCIHEIINCPYKGALKQMYLQTKCTELLILQAESFAHESETAGKKIIKTGYDRDCIYQAKDFLLTHLDAPPSLSALAKEVGINEFKLKNGFRELFDNTVFGYLNEYRMQKAKELLLSGIPIKHVADELGYSSVQHFGTAFRKKYGMPPGRLKSN